MSPERLREAASFALRAPSALARLGVPAFHPFSRSFAPAAASAGSTLEPSLPQGSLGHFIRIERRVCRWDILSG